MSIYFEPALEDIDNLDAVPYRGEHQCYADIKGDTVFHGTEADFLYELEYNRNGVECINANWYDLLRTLQDIYEDAEIIDMTSSAGDWMLAFKTDDGRWYPAWQENGYPRFRGYRWTISREWSGATIEELLAVLDAATWPVGDVWDDIPAP